MENVASNPIGIFDSGIGGLTLAHAIHELLPNEKLIYFGDTAHLPYGDKSPAAIQAYTVKICDMLLEQGCKVIVIACNSASTAAYELAKEYVASKALVLNVIDPVIEHLQQNHANQSVGLIGTKQTITSNAYKKKIDALNIGIELFSLATPLLVPMIEEGYCHGKLTHELIHEYLSQPELANIQALILGCTHYPLIKQEIDNYYKNQITIIDSSLIVSEFLKNILEKQSLMNKSKGKGLYFYISDYTDSFAKTAQMFFEGDLKLEHYPLWE